MVGCIQMWLIEKKTPCIPKRLVRITPVSQKRASVAISRSSVPARAGSARFSAGPHAEPLCLFATRAVIFKMAAVRERAPTRPPRPPSPRESAAGKQPADPTEKPKEK